MGSFLRGKKGARAWVIFAGLVVIYSPSLNAQTITTGTITSPSPLNSNPTFKINQTSGTTATTVNPAVNADMPVCGNGIREGKESCDGTDGISEAYTCDNRCRLEEIFSCSNGEPVDALCVANELGGNVVCIDPSTKQSIMTFENLPGASGVAKKLDGNLIITDDLNRLILLDKRTGQSTLLASGENGAPLYNPNGNAINSEGNIAIANAGGGNVVFYNTTSHTFNDQPLISDLNTPQGATNDSQDVLYVSDYTTELSVLSPSGTLSKFDLDSAVKSYANQNKMTSLDWAGSEGGISFADNKVYAAAYQQGYVLRFDVNTREVDWIKQTGGNPRGTAVKNGKLFVSLYTENKIVKIDLSTSESITFIDSNSNLLNGPFNMQWITLCPVAEPVTLAEEQCNNQDDDGDGSIDENLTVSCSTVCGGGTSVCNNGIWTSCDAPAETDGNGNGMTDCLETPSQCGNGLVESGEGCDEGISNSDTGTCNNQCQPTYCGDGIVQNEEECDDGNKTEADGCNSDCTIPCNPGTQETCDCKEGCPYGDPKYPDCNPENDNTVCDWTGGSHGCSSEGKWGYCVKPTEPAQPACQPTAETCSDWGIDNDCDGIMEEADVGTIAVHPDNDGDGFGDQTTTLQVCVKQDGVVDDGTDCNDQDKDMYPGNPEVCDGKDNDCNGQVDDGIDCNQTPTFTCPSGEPSQSIGCFATAEKKQVVCYNEKGDIVVQAAGYTNVTGVTADPSTSQALIWGHDHHLHFIMNEPVSKGSTTIKDYTIQTITLDKLAEEVKIADLTRAQNHVYVLDTEGKVYGFDGNQQIAETLDFGEAIKWISMTNGGKLVGMTMNGIIKTLTTSEAANVKQDATGEIDAKSYLSQKGYSLESLDGVVYENMMIFTNSAANQIVAIDTSKFTSPTPDTATLDSATTFMNVPFTPSALAMRTDVEALVVSGLDDGQTYFISGKDNKYTSGQTYTLTADDLQTIQTPEAQGATSLDGWQGCEGTFDSGELTDEVCDGQDNDGDGVADNGLDPETCCFQDTDCDDGDACTTDSCELVAGTTASQCLHKPSNPDDGNACTNDSCDPTTGDPINDPIADCCTTSDDCADDGNACTTEECVLGASGSNGVATGTCSSTTTDPNDGDACTTDACDSTTGLVSNTPVDTDDGDACTFDECNASTGAISHTPKETSDGDACTTDSCDPATGNVSHVDVATDDNNACTIDACNQNTGEVSHVSKETNDGDACTDDSCNTTTGQISHTAVSVDDGNTCTTDSCNSNTGAINHDSIASCCNSDSDCDDGNACNGTETCVAAAAGSICQDGTALTCDDSNDCTDDFCDASTGCHYTDVASAAGNACGSCGDGEVNSGEECDDGNTDDNDGCTANCTEEEEEEEGYCGDGEVQSDLKEECDGDAPEGYECTFKCTLIEKETCDDGSTPRKALCVATTQKIECIDQDSTETRKQYETTNDPVRILADQNRELYVKDSQGDVSKGKVTANTDLAREATLAQTEVIGFDQQARAIVADSVNNRIDILKDGTLEILVADVSMKGTVVGDRDELWVLGNNLKVRKYKSVDGVHTAVKEIDFSSLLTDSDEIKKVAFAKNQIFVATATRILSVEPQKAEITTLLTDADIDAMTVDPRTKQIFIADSQGTIRTFDPDTTYSAKRPDELTTLVKPDDPKAIGDLATTDACPEPTDDPETTTDSENFDDSTSPPETSNEETTTGAAADGEEAESAGTETGTVTEQASENEEDEEPQIEAEGGVTAEECVQGNGVLEALEDLSLLMAVQNGEIDNINGDPVVYEDGMIKGVCTGYRAAVSFRGGGCSLQKRPINPTCSASIFFLLILSNFLLILPIRRKI